MGQIRTYTVTLVNDQFALPGTDWWARCDTDTLEPDGCIGVTTLQASVVSALNEATVMLLDWMATAEPEPEEARNE